MKNTNKKKNAFTLTETLFALFIVGVIAGMTLPTLKKTSDEAATSAKVQKAFTTLSNATQAIKTERGAIRFLPWDKNAEIMENIYLKKINTMKNCKNEGGCFDDDYKVLYLDGKEGDNFQKAKKWYTFIGIDGMHWAVETDSSCSLEEKNGANYSYQQACGFFAVDVNGPIPPNTVGVDIFGFVVTPEGTYPAGGCPDCESNSCKEDSGTGWACTARILSGEKISW